MRHVLLLMSLLLAACSTTPRAADRPARLNHVVLIKLNDPGQTAALIADCDRQLATIPGVRSYFCGRPIDLGGPFVDDDYDVGMYIGFDDAAAYQAYLDHAQHQYMVETWGPRFEWMRTHDVVDETR